MYRWRPIKPGSLCCREGRQGIRDEQLLYPAFWISLVRLIQLRTCDVKCCVVGSRHFGGDAWEKAHISSRRVRIKQDCMWLPDAAVCRWLFPLFLQKCSDPFALKYHHFVAPLLHSLPLLPFTTKPDASQHSLSLLHSSQLSHASFSKVAL